MSPSEQGRSPSTAIQVVFGVLLAGTGLYLVPTLVLNGAGLIAAIAAVIWIGGISAAWYLYRRDIALNRKLLDRERAAHDLYRSLVERGSEAHVVVGPRGEIVFASPNAQAVLGADPERLESLTGLLGLVHEDDRRRALRAVAAVRSGAGATVSVEVGARRPEGDECHFAVRASNLTESPDIQGFLVHVRDVTPRKTFEHLAYYDALTGLANRRFFFEQGKKALSMARRNRESMAVLCLDLDRFRQVNEVLGHEKGDELLKQVAASLENTLREADVIARLGGDEFGVVLTEARDPAAVGRVARRVVETMPPTVVAAGHQIPTRASVGVAMFPADAGNLESLLKAADLAMSRAKSEASGVQFYRPELRRMLADQIRLEEDLRQAMEHHEFRLHYQPVFSLATGEMAGAEALTRWRHIGRGVVSASEFIRLAEKVGLIQSLDRWAITRAVHQRTAQPGGSWQGWVAVNLAPHSLRDPDLPAFIREMLETTDLEPGTLVLEMPAGAVFEEPDIALELMWALKDTGAAIALDDYGDTAVSFAQLRKLPIDILKLHRDLVVGIGSGHGNEHMIEATISIAHGISAKVLAKGVEREAQVAWLRDSSCDFIQGYLVGAPVPAKDLPAGAAGRW
jgi:diguanylate cyclase (GGDEF)-like protein/PAS domain S-box-containing protein